MTRFLLLALVALPLPGTLRGQDSTRLRIERIGTLTARQLRESSGVAVSRAHQGILWTHNDSGDSATVYAINLFGDLLGSYHVPNASARDWEDIALGPCPDAPGRCLYIGDTGDNNERRRSVTIYVVPEPTPVHPGGDSVVRQTAPARSLTIRYPDRPHDVEALAADPNGDLYLITKGRTSPIRVYLVAREAFKRDSATAVAVDTLPFVPFRQLGRWVTGADISPSGQRLVVRTYTELYFYRREGGKLVPDGTCWIGGLEPQGEAVAFLDEVEVILTSEAVRDDLGPTLRVRCLPARARTRP